MAKFNYIKTRSLMQFSNVLGDTRVERHPTKFKLADGEIVHISHEDRFNAVEYNYYSGKNKKYIPLKKGISFKILDEWENNASTSGSWIEWSLPNGTEILE